mmetsp:Transcript_43610/g.115184  ORF Transcript_43610/g.115184 Transcript_43610/m.115184 type:complete len:292 (-) Transcript_43610:291-1166(-)
MDTSSPSSARRPFLRRLSRLVTRKRRSLEHETKTADTFCSVQAEAQTGIWKNTSRAPCCPSSNESSNASQPKALRASEPELPVDSDMEKLLEDVSQDEISEAGFHWTSVDQSHLGSRFDQAADSSFCTENASISSDRSSGCEVILHVYDLHPITRRTSLPVFHTGIQVYGCELCYCSRGLEWNEPCTSSKHVHKRSVSLGWTSLTATRIVELCDELSKHWVGDQYSIFNKNCQTFTVEFSRLLGVQDKVPPQVVRFSSWGPGARGKRSSRGSHSEEIEQLHYLSRIYSVVG